MRMTQIERFFAYLKLLKNTPIHFNLCHPHIILPADNLPIPIPLISIPSLLCSILLLPFL